MEARLKITDANSVKFTLTLTADLKTWIALKKQLERDWPSWEIGKEISNMVSQANADFTPDE